MASQLNEEGKLPEKMVTALWCFACDTEREGKVGDKCPGCGAVLKEVSLKPRLNMERLTYIGILTLLALVSALLLPMGEMAAGGVTPTPANGTCQHE